LRGSLLEGFATWPLSGKFRGWPIAHSVALGFSVLLVRLGIYAV